MILIMSCKFYKGQNIRYEWSKYISHYENGTDVLFNFYSFTFYLLAYPYHYNLIHLERVPRFS